jgi:hypothetical protein
MLIRYGYEITLTCQQPTALVCLLSVHDDRAADIRVPETTFSTPDVPVSTYRDLFGNKCRAAGRACGRPHDVGRRDDRG